MTESWSTDPSTRPWPAQLCAIIWKELGSVLMCYHFRADEHHSLRGHGDIFSLGAMWRTRSYQLLTTTWSHSHCDPLSQLFCVCWDSQGGPLAAQISSVFVQTWPSVLCGWSDSTDTKTGLQRKDREKGLVGTGFHLSMVGEPARFCCDSPYAFDMHMYMHIWICIHMYTHPLL